MEALSRIVSAIVVRGFLSGFLVGARNNAEPFVSYLLFADYTIIFCVANYEQLRHL